MDAEERKWLVELRTDVKWLREHFNNHLKHHFMFTIAIVTVFGGGFFGLLYLFLR